VPHATSRNIRGINEPPCQSKAQMDPIVQPRLSSQSPAARHVSQAVSFVHLMHNCGHTTSSGPRRHRPPPLHSWRTRNLKTLQMSATPRISHLHRLPHSHLRHMIIRQRKRQGSGDQGMHVSMMKFIPPCAHAQRAIQQYQHQLPCMA
jgi:hypothetical protein